MAFRSLGLPFITQTSKDVARGADMYAAVRPAAASKPDLTMVRPQFDAVGAGAARRTSAGRCGIRYP